MAEFADRQVVRRFLLFVQSASSSLGAPLPGRAGMRFCIWLVLVSQLRDFPWPLRIFRNSGPSLGPQTQTF